MTAALGVCGNRLVGLVAALMTISWRSFGDPIPEMLPHTDRYTKACKVFRVPGWSNPLAGWYNKVNGAFPGQWLDRESDCHVDFRQNDGALYMGVFCSSGPERVNHDYSPDHYEIFFDSGTVRRVSSAQWSIAGSNVFLAKYLERAKLPPTRDRLIDGKIEYPMSAKPRCLNHLPGSMDTHGSSRISIDQRWITVNSWTPSRSCEESGTYYVDIYRFQADPFELAPVTKLLTIRGIFGYDFGGSSEDFNTLAIESGWLDGRYFFLPLHNLTFTQFFLCDAEQLEMESAKREAKHKNRK